MAFPLSYSCLHSMELLECRGSTEQSVTVIQAFLGPGNWDLVTAVD